MPKSRIRKPKDRGRPAARKLSATEKAQLRAQKAAFREKFGRDPGPNDPLFFDPTKDEPEPLEDIEEAVLAAMHKADLPPEFAYAFKKTGLIGLTADKSRWPPERIEE